MKSNNSQLSFESAVLTVAIAVIVLLTPLTTVSQSTDQQNPTPVLSQQINGEIRARDIGDSRDTRYYYIFTGNRGDVFVNVVTKNINGTIDIFTRNGLSARTKITLFADDPDGETGRIVYMRKSEMLILRIQGRTPNDDPGTYQIKFAGSFAPATGVAENDDEPRVDSDQSGSVRVNSVGTIIEEPPAPKVEKAPVEDAQKAAKSETAEKRPDEPGDEVPDATPEAVVKDDPLDDKAKSPAKSDRNKPSVVVSDPFEDSPEAKKDTGAKDIESKEVTVNINTPKPKRSALVTISRAKPDEDVVTEPDKPANTEPTLEEKLAKVQLRITLKNGDSFSRPMNEVLSINVIRGVLTIVTTDGRIQEFSILDVEKMSIE